jgi:hypothetical protein
MDHGRDDEGFEVLDIGRGRDSAPAAAQHDLPPLDLAEPVADGSGQPLGSRSGPWHRWWRRWGMVAAVFLIGVAVGAYIWNVRSDAAALAVEDGRAVLVAGWFGFDQSLTGFDVSRPTVTLHNTGARDVEVISVRPAGWLTHADPAVGRSTTVPPAEWVEVRMAALPPCGEPVPGRLEAEIRSGQGEFSMTVALPPGGRLDQIQAVICDEVDMPYSVIVNRTVGLAASEPGTLRTIVTLSVASRAAVEITAASTSEAGFRAVATGPPVGIPDDAFETSVSLGLEWNVEECAATHSLDELALHVEVRTASATTTVAAQLPTQLYAMLGRFAAAECGP